MKAIKNKRLLKQTQYATRKRKSVTSVVRENRFSGQKHNAKTKNESVDQRDLHRLAGQQVYDKEKSEKESSGHLNHRLA